MSFLFKRASTSVASKMAPDDSKEVAGTHEGAPKLNLKGTLFPLAIINSIPGTPRTFAISCGNIKVIQALDGQLITKSFLAKPKINDGFVVSDTDRDILKIVVLNRYQASKPAIAFIRGFGFKQGAIASTVAHDSHNIIAVGTDDTQIVEAINKIIKSKGGISLVEDDQSLALPLPVAGIMSNDDGYKVGELYEKINGRAKRLGSDLHAPFMTLSFMALLVIPELKLSDKGLFDGDNFQFTSLFEN